MKVLVSLALALIGMCLPLGGFAEMNIPDDLPRFSVPGHEEEMATLRELFWLHYPGSGPKATLWDEWLPMPAMWPAVETDGTADRFRPVSYTHLTLPTILLV